MRFYPTPDGSGPFWLGPAFLGLVLILISVLLWFMPDLLAYVVASLFFLAGCGLLGVAWRMRRRVTYQRIDRPGEAHEAPEGPPRE